MNLMAIDASTKSTGVAIYTDGKLIHYECITATSTDLFKRIHKMIGELDRLYNEYKIDTIIMEDVLPEDVKHNQKVFKALMYLQAEVVDKFNDYKKTIEFVYPSEWRSKCKIKQGRGVKRETGKAYDIAFVKEIFNIDANDDICDAICIGYSYFTKDNTIEILEGGFELG